MSIQLSSNFLLSAQLPLDSRTVVADLTARDAIVSINRYEGLVVYVLSDTTNYQLVGGITNGDWFPFVGGGGGIIGQTVIGGDPNRILFIDGSGNLADSSRLQFDQTTGAISSGNDSLTLYSSLDAVYIGSGPSSTTLKVQGGLVTMENQLLVPIVSALDGINFIEFNDGGGNMSSQASASMLFEAATQFLFTAPNAQFTGTTTLNSLTYTWPGSNVAGPLVNNGSGTLSWGSGTGYASSVSNSDGTLTISPTTGNVVASLNLAHANTWTAAQKINVNSTTAFFVEQDGVMDNVFTVDTASARVGINISPSASAYSFSCYRPTTASTNDVALFEIQTTGTTLQKQTIEVKATSTGASSDGFGPQIVWTLRDNSATNNTVGSVSFVRNGADNTGMGIINTLGAGVVYPVIHITPSALGVGYNISAADLNGFIGIALDSQSASAIQVIRNHTAGVAGNILYLQGGSAGSGGAGNANGGNLQLYSGDATGNGGSRILFFTTKFTQGAGTTARVAAQTLQLDTGLFTFANPTITTTLDWTTSGQLNLTTGNFMVGSLASPDARAEIFRASTDSTTWSLRSSYQTAATNVISNSFSLRTLSTGVMTDGFGGGIVFQVRDTDAVDNNIGRLAVSRNGADNTGKMIFDVATAGSLATILNILDTNQVGIQQTTPTALLHFGAGTATANTAPIKLTTGTALTVVEDGAIEYHTSHLYFSIGGTRYQLDQQSSGGTVAGADTQVQFNDGGVFGADSAFTWNKTTNRLTPNYITLAAGDTAAGSAPIKMTTGSLMTSPEAGALELLLTDPGHLYITTNDGGSPTRHKVVMTEDTTNLTSGQVGFGSPTQAGRLKGDDDMVFVTDTLTVTKIVGTTSITSALITTTGTVRLKGYTVGTLPAGTVGDTAYVTDALAPTFLAIIVGGGAIVTPVFYNGTNWVGY